MSRYRPQLDIDQVATGEVWLGQAALGRQLIDELKTSDEYLCERAREATFIYCISPRKKSLQERVGMAASSTLDGVLTSLQKQRFW